MKYIYIIKHYWDEKSYGATIEPQWIFSKDNLNKEEKKIKEIIKNYISLSKYNELSLKKPFFEKIDNLYIYFCYKDKDDPDPTNNRKVTDITFIIAPKKLKNPCKLLDNNVFKIPLRNYFKYFIFIIFLILISWIGFQYLLNLKEKNITPKPTIQLEKKIKLENNNKQIKKESSKKESKLALMCNKYKNQISKEGFCYQKFFYNICNHKNIKITYNNWLKKDKICSIEISNVKKDKDLKSVSNELQNFIKRYPNE